MFSLCVGEQRGFGCLGTRQHARSADCLRYPGTRPDAGGNPKVFLWLLWALVGLLNLTGQWSSGQCHSSWAVTVLCWTCNLKPCFKLISLHLLSPCLFLLTTGNSVCRHMTATLQPNWFLREMEGSREEEQSSQSTEGTRCDNSRTGRWLDLACGSGWGQWLVELWLHPGRQKLWKKHLFNHTESSRWVTPPLLHLSHCFPPLSVCLLQFISAVLPIAASLDFL